MTDTQRNVITIGPNTLCCPCHGRPLWREYRPDYSGTYRYLDSCTVDGAELGWDAAITRETWERVQARKRLEAARCPRCQDTLRNGRCDFCGWPAPSVDEAAGWDDTHEGDIYFTGDATEFMDALNTVRRARR